MTKKDFFFIIFVVFLTGFLVVAFNFFQIKKAPQIQAGSSQNVLGWAWSENIGWTL
jgi:hypothetical protein